MKRRDRRRTAGFTLLELIAVLAIVAVLAALIIPSAISLNEDAQKRAEVRRTVTELRQARATVLSRGEMTPGVVVVNTGVIVVSPTEYRRFSDNDATSGGEVIDQIVDLSDSGVTIEFPAAGSQIRFRNNGTRVAASPSRIDLRAATGQLFRVDVPLSGLSHLN